MNRTLIQKVEFVKIWWVNYNILPVWHDAVPQCVLPVHTFQIFRHDYSSRMTWQVWSLDLSSCSLILVEFAFPWQVLTLLRRAWVFVCGTWKQLGKYPCEHAALAAEESLWQTRVYLIYRAITFVDFASHMWSHVWPISKRQLYSPTGVACCCCHLWFITMHQAASIALVSWGLTTSPTFLLDGSLTDDLKWKACVYLVSVEAFILLI